MISLKTTEGQTQRYLQTESNGTEVVYMNKQCASDHLQNHLAGPLFKGPNFVECPLLPLETIFKQFNP